MSHRVCMRYITIGLLVVGIFCIGNLASAEMSSTNYIIRWDTVSQGGSDTSTSTTYLLRDTLGNAGAGTSSSTSYLMRAGYRQGIGEPVIIFDIEAAQASSEMTASLLAGTTVTVDETSSVNINDLVILVQDRGASEIDAIGRVTGKTVDTVIVDEFTDAGTSPVIDGTNDYLFVLSGVTANLGELDPAAVNTSVIGWDVTTDIANGYSVFITEDGELRTGANTIDEVTDATVTAGAEEYGARSSDTTLTSSTFDTQDTAFTGDFGEVASESIASFASRNFLVLKASMTDGVTAEGNYAHTLSFIVSANF